MTQEFFTYDRLLKRGWTDEKITAFLSPNYNKDNVKVCAKAEVLRKEKFRQWKNFKDIDSFLLEKNSYVKLEKEKTKNFLNTFGSTILNTKLHKTPQSLLTQTLANFEKISRGDTSLFNPVNVHLIPQSQGIQIFCDGALKNFYDKEVACLGVWAKNDKGELLFEFASRLPPEVDDLDFELYAIEKAMLLARDLNITTFTLINDCSSEVESVTKFLKEYDTPRSLVKGKTFKNIASLAKDVNFTAVYLPREYNNHCDLLSKIYIDYERIKYKEKIAASIHKNLNLTSDEIFKPGAEVYFYHPNFNTVNESVVDNISPDTLYVSYNTYTKQIEGHKKSITHDFVKFFSTPVLNISGINFEVEGINAYTEHLKHCPENKKVCFINAHQGIQIVANREKAVEAKSLSSWKGLHEALSTNSIDMLLPGPEIVAKMKKDIRRHQNKVQEELKEKKIKKIIL